MKTLVVLSPDYVERLSNRFWPKVEVGLCWHWLSTTGGQPGRTYGTISVAGGMWYAHRVAWELLVGPIPEDMTIDHLCRNRYCVNPDHMELVTRAENVRRGETAAVRRNRNRICKKGHPIIGENVYVTNAAKGWARCRTCFRAALRARYV